MTTLLWKILGAGTKGPITGEAGNLGYQEICLKFKNEGWTAVEDSNGPYAYGSGNQWVGYDTIKSVTAKAEYVKTKGLGGAMFWDLATDDFNVSIPLSKVHCNTVLQLPFYRTVVEMADSRSSPLCQMH